MVRHKVINNARSALFLAIITLVIANLALTDFVLAKKVEITSKDVTRIKNSIDTVQLFSGIFVSDEKIRTALNLFFRGGEAGADITYGLVVLSATNEIELIDMVLSQRFKIDAAAYFEGIIAERTNLISHWEGVGTDISRVATAGSLRPMSALTLNSFSIGNTVFQIFLAVKNIAMVQKYNGLWGYFDYRGCRNSSHEDAWQNAKDLMRWIREPEDVEKYSWVRGIDNQVNQLESQFAKLWDTWGPYTDCFGVIGKVNVTDTAKRQFKEEMGQLVVEAVGQQALAEKERGPSLLEKIIGYLGDKAYEVFTGAWNAIRSTVSQVNLFGGAEVGQQVLEVVPRSEAERAEIFQKVSLAKTQEAEPEIPDPAVLAELQRQINEAARMVKALNIQVQALIEAKEKEYAVEYDEELNEDEKLDEQKEVEFSETQEEVCSVNINTVSAEELEKITGVGPVISQRIIEARPYASLSELEAKVKGIGPATLQKIIDQGCAYVAGGSSSGMPHPVSEPEPSYSKILISEVKISPIEERFIELYNPNDENVDLTGWYIQRKTKTGSSFGSLVTSTQFEGKTIGAKSYFLIVRSGDGDIVLSTLTLTEHNTIRLRNPNQETVDMVGWGNEAQESETAPAENPPSGKSAGRIWQESNQNYQDTDNNSADFEIQTQTPKAKNQSPEIETPSLTVVINEIAWAGTQASSTADQWIELYNATSSEITLTNWYLLSSSGTKITLEGIIYSESAGEDGEEGGGGGGDFDLGPYFVIERKTDDKTSAQLSDGSGALLRDQFVSFGGGFSDTDCEILSLYDSEDKLVDKTSCLGTGGWPAGKASPNYVSMERINPKTSGQNTSNWADNDGVTKNGSDAGGNSINGTPKSQNSVYQSG